MQPVSQHHPTPEKKKKKKKTALPHFHSSAHLSPPSPAPPLHTRKLAPPLTTPSPLAAAKRVLAFLRADSAAQQAPYSTQQQLQYQQQVEYVESIANQLAHIKHNPKADQQQLKLEGKWLDAIEVVHFVEGLLSKARAAMEALQGKQWAFSSMWEGDAKVQAAGRMVHDALLAAFNFGYMPPIRPTCIITIKHPAMASTAAAGCKEAGCTITGCQGNRLCKLEQGRWQLQLPHHKNARK